MRMLTMENESWKFACGAYDWMKLNLGFSQTTTEIDNLVSTIMQVFVLKTCTIAYRGVTVDNNPQNGL